MASAYTLLALTLTVTSCFAACGRAAPFPTTVGVRGRLAGVKISIINALPKGSSQLYARCNGLQTAIVGGDRYEFLFRSLSVPLIYCDAQWGNLIAPWHGYQRRRDQGHATVYWLVRQDGIYLSWDKRQWVRKVVWWRD